MNTFKLYSVSDRYINFLRSNPELKHVFDNKENYRTHSRKYLGLVFKVKEMSYYIPFASPKKSDYFIDKDGNECIRKSMPTIIRMTSENNFDNKTILLGTLKISNMIPVPQSELVLYDVSQEKDKKYKDVVDKEIIFIRKNSKTILDNAKLVYNQKIYYEKNPPENGEKMSPAYLNSVIPFRYAEKKYLEFCQELEHSNIIETATPEHNSDNNIDNSRNVQTKSPAPQPVPQKQSLKAMMSKAAQQKKDMAAATKSMEKWADDVQDIQQSRKNNIHR